jgi:hypothetical protein
MKNIPLESIFSSADVWQWKTTSNAWTTFSDGACRHLDAAVLHELKTASFEEDKNEYSINIVTKELVNNTSKQKGTARYISKEIAG